MLFDYHFCKEWLFNQPLYDSFQLHQIGRAYCTPGAVIPSHVHPNLFELTIAMAVRERYTQTISRPTSPPGIFIFLSPPIFTKSSRIRRPR